MMQSISAIEASDDTVKQKWLSFWCVFGIFQTIEMFIGFLLNFIPYYSWLRVVFFVYLMHPTTNGAQLVYEKVFKKYLKEHEKEINALIESVTERASNVGTDLAKQAKEKAKEMGSTENMIKMAGAAQQIQQKLNEGEKTETLDSQ